MAISSQLLIGTVFRDNSDFVSNTEVIASLYGNRVERGSSFTPPPRHLAFGPAPMWMLHLGCGGLNNVENNVAPHTGRT